MSTVTRTRTIDATAAELWQILSGLDRYIEWESGYVSSAYVTDRHEGLGTRREVRLKSPMGVRTALHEITRWDEEEAIAWTAISSNFPFLGTAEQTVTLGSGTGGTLVKNQVVYELRYGVLGRVVDGLMFSRVVTGAAQGFVDSLAARAESGGGS